MDLVSPSELAGVGRAYVALHSNKWSVQAFMLLFMQIHIIPSQALLILLSLGATVIFIQQSH